ncbi:exodeoxyribonuclease V subunit gamma [Paraneptunicella aestuarii]|uniref:exodeoxyribonuclease V subunit gamma n=1 Tax=Paraneptunicella aestuarii TaxID=2831148 RepID=UPI001E5B3E2F|nr:exodeoxyribonuclease V subunit gamma [Paraneptunicella aestuarii]UAA40493.1 exodeoxyribonuclease V subunit gamma [Paraneptunicella aestuarii]
MLHLVQSNKMEVLCEQLIQRISHYYQSNQSQADQHFSHILTPLPILVQSPGMSQWLKIRIAEYMGIAANLSFPLPSSYIWDLYRRNIADLPKQSAFTKDNMQWKLMQLLPECAQLENFRAIHDYLNVSEKEDKGVSELRKRYQLAGKIADIYDQYLVYRPDWLMAWEAGETAKGVDVSTQPWQPELWRMLLQKTRQLGESPWHRANLHEQLLNALKRRSNRSEATPPVFVFGISAIPKQQLEIFEALAQQGDVVLFWCNPCEHYWGDIISVEQKEKKQLDLFEQQALKEQSSEALLALSLYETGNPLLASWGKLGREFQDMLLELDERGNMHVEDYFIEPPREHLLAHIQNDILGLTTPTESAGMHGDMLSESDNSMIIMSCHSRLRELEVLHDHLLRQLEHHPELSLGDIIVMMPDIAEYAPFIDAVFGGAEAQRYLAYAISDRNVVDESPVVKAFLQLLNLHQSRFTLTEVVELFSVPDVLTQFRVQESELDILQHWLRDSGVRWGLDAQDKQRWDLPTEGQNTWLFGLQRLLAGYAMAFDETPLATDDAEVLPYVDLEGQQVEVLGKFIEFLSTLESILSEAELESSIQDKVMMAERWLQRLFAESEEQGYYRQQILDALATLAEHGEQYPGLIDQDVFVEAVNQQLSSKGVGQRFLAGKINFCTLMPMRSIPFKQVCILGLNDPGYPRIVTPVGFDLMAVSPSRKGDRSRRYDDRYLFLEAILSTRQQLYLSYIGRDEKDNSEKAPSILLTELQHYCNQYETSGSETAMPRVLEHPLQPFHRDYYRESSKSGTVSKSYNQHWLSVLKAGNSVANAEARNTSSLAGGFTSQALDDIEQDKRNELSLNELISCLLNPARYFFEHRWHTRFGRPLSNSEDDEPLLLDALSRYQLSHELIRDTQSQNNGRDITRQLKMAGKLPVGRLAEEAIDEVNQLVDKVKEQVAQHLPGLDLHQAAQWLDISCNIAADMSQTHMHGRIEGIYPLGTRNLSSGVSAHSRALVLWRPGKLRAQDRLQLWVKWLLIQSQQSFKDNTAADVEKAYFFATDDVMVLPSLSPEFASNTLNELLQFWRDNNNQPQCFFPETAWVWAKSQDQQKAINAYVGNDFGGGNRAESTEAHFHRICPDLAEQFGEFSECADKILSPLLAVLEGE